MDRPHNGPRAGQSEPPSRPAQATLPGPTPRPADRRKAQTQAPLRSSARVPSRYLWNQTRASLPTTYGARRSRAHSNGRCPLAPVLRSRHERAGRGVADIFRARLLRRGGLVTSTSTGPQLDAPNASAPLQWITIEGLSDYGEIAPAQTIAQRWMLKAFTACRAAGKLIRITTRRNPHKSQAAGVPHADGFGSTIGALRRLLVLCRTRSPPPR